MDIKISKGNSKVGNIPSVSMPPIKACGNCKACAKDCYALKAYRMYPNVKKAYDSNFKLAKSSREKYFKGIIAYLEKKAPRFFRWHVSGDILDQDYLNNMSVLALAFPDVKFLAFTKMHHLDFGVCPNNLEIVFSMFPSMPTPAKSKRRVAWMQDGAEKRIPSDALNCPGNCETCGLCWNLSKIKKDVYFFKH